MKTTAAGEARKAAIRVVRSSTSKRHPPADDGQSIPAELLQVSRRTFLKTGTIEMGALAREMKIGRATIYRWAGDRDNLLSEVLLSLGVANLARAERDIKTASGPQRIYEVTDLYLKRMWSNTSYRKFLRTEREAAERVILNPAGNLSRGWEATWAGFVRRVESSSGF